ncbi:MAG: hypothetical protein O2894_10375, partial [Planctomycetota bacterium]|nr:hypothetical protein [Planctomycetota bacterium]
MRSPLYRLVLWLLPVAALLPAAVARGEPDPEALALTRLGAQAYEQGVWEAAAEAFEAALAR